MAAPDFSPSRLGQVNGGGAVDALFRKLYSLEVQESFMAATVAADKHLVSSIASGKSIEFPFLGNVTAEYVTAGTFYTGDAVGANGVTVLIDGQLAAKSFIADIDELMNHYEVRGRYSSIFGKEIARQFDIHVINSMILAARTATPVITGNPAGATSNIGTALTSGTDLAGGIYAAADTFEENGIDQNMATCFVKPAQRSLLVQALNPINTLYGGSGSYSEGTIAKIAGITIQATPNLLRKNLVDDNAITAAAVRGVTTTNLLAAYRGNFAVTAAVITTPEAVATAKLQDLTTAMQRFENAYGTFLTSVMACGTKVFRPECAFEIRTANP